MTPNEGNARAPPKLVIECARCGRHGEYARDKARKRFGKIDQQDFLFHVVTAECLDEAPIQARLCGKPGGRRLSCRLIRIVHAAVAADGSARLIGTG